LHHLRRVGQRAPDWLRLSPQGLAPALETDGRVVLTQSMAICEWLDKMHPEPPLLPGTALQRARIRAFAQAIARDIRPVQNPKVFARLRRSSGLPRRGAGEAGGCRIGLPGRGGEWHSSWRPRRSMGLPRRA
jgi:maleylpyruvate isomerase